MTFFSAKRTRIATLTCGAALILDAMGCGSPASLGTPTAGTNVVPTTSGNGATPGAMQSAGVKAPPNTSTAGSAAGSVATLPTSGSGASTAGSGSAGMTAPTTAAGDWTMMGYDVTSSYFNKTETTISKDTVAKLGVAWMGDLGGAIYSAPLQVGDKIYGAGPGVVKSFEAATGKELWKTTVSSTASLAYANGMLYVNNGAGQMVALNATDGKQLWMKPYNTQTSDGNSSPIPAGSFLLIGGSNGNDELSGGGTFKGFLSAMNPMTGDMLWTTPTVPDGAKGASIWSSPTADIEAGMAYGATGNNYTGSPATDSSDSIVAFDLKTGKISWKHQALANDVFPGSGPDADFGANPVLFETMVKGTMTKLVGAGTKGGSVYVVARDTGKEVWKRTLCTGASDGSRGIFTNSSWSGKNFLVACNEGGPATLYGLDGGTGDITWMRALTGQVWGRIAVANGVGFVGTGVKVEAFDVATGAMIKTFPTQGGTAAGTISVANGRVAFGEGLQWLANGVGGSTLTVLTIK